MAAAARQAAAPTTPARPSSRPDSAAAAHAAAAQMASATTMPVQLMTVTRRYFVLIPSGLAAVRDKAPGYVARASGHPLAEGGRQPLARCRGRDGEPGEGHRQRQRQGDQEPARSLRSPTAAT